MRIAPRIENGRIFPDMSVVSYLENEVILGFRAVRRQEPWPASRSGNSTVVHTFFDVGGDTQVTVFAAWIVL